MKRILSLVLVFTCIFSSFTFLASAEESTETSTETSTEASTETNTETSTETNTETSTEHVHERSPYIVYYTETTHRYKCSTCDEYYTENHMPAEEGKCPCGYFDHEHKPEAWYMVGLYSDDTRAVHSYICSECKVLGWIEEEHTFDENGICPSCGWIDSENPNLNSFDILRTFFRLFPSIFNFLAKIIGKGIEMAMDILD